MPAPRLREVVDDPVDLGFGADVDAAGRLVEDQHLRLGLQPARQQALLLVAARQRAHATAGLATRIARRRRPSWRPASCGRGRARRPWASLPMIIRLMLSCRHVEQDALGLAVLRQISQPGVDRVLRAADLDRLAGQRPRRRSAGRRRRAAARAPSGPSRPGRRGRAPRRRAARSSHGLHAPAVGEVPHFEHRRGGAVKRWSFV